jgi:hypothetical protein
MSVRSVSDNVRQTAPPVSTNVRQKRGLIARRAVHDCAPLHLYTFTPNQNIPTHSRWQRFLQLGIIALRILEAT